MGTPLVARWWFGDALVAVVFGTIVALAATMSPSPDAVALFGWDVPIVCTWRNITGIPCPGCGLTRSFAFMAHGSPIEAFRMNWLGPLLFVVFASQPPYRVWVIWQGLKRRRARAAMA